MATIIPDPFVERYYNAPFDMEWRELRFWDRIPNGLKENERYSLSGKHSYQWGMDRYRDPWLGVELKDFQTGEIIDLDLGYLLKRVRTNELGMQQIGNGYINKCLLNKFRNAKPYITQKEMIEYFENLVGSRYIYFTFTKTMGSPYGKNYIGEAILINAYFVE